jgi:hypothetical protein
MSCPNSNCIKGFIGYYIHGKHDQNWHFNGHVSNEKTKSREFNKKIQNLLSSLQWLKELSGLEMMRHTI